MGHFGLTELLIIMVVILLLFGAKRIPEVAGSMGKGIREFKEGMNELGNDVNPNSTVYPPPRLTSEDLQRPTQSAPAPEAERREPRRLI